MDYDHGMMDQQQERGAGGPPYKKPRGDNNGSMNNGGVMDHLLERGDEKIPPNHILLFTIFNAKFTINVEVIYKVCSIVGKVKKIVCFERMNISQAMVEFETLESASKARSSLHGCDIYNNCCTMKVEYSKLETLNVRANNEMNWDFDDGADYEGKRPVILNSPDYGSYGGYSGSMGASSMGSAGSMGGNMGHTGGMGGGNMGGGNMGASNLGGGSMGGNQNKMGMGGMADMGGVTGSGYGYGMAQGMDQRSCVMLVYGLEPPKWNCDKLFNLLCQYGNVNKVFFMKNKPNTAMVEMGTPEGVDNVTRNLHDLFVFGEKLRFDVSKKHLRIENRPLEFQLEDGSSSVKEFYNERNMNRFMTPDMARKNRIIHPSKVLHFFNILKVDDSVLENLFTKVGATLPIQIKWVPAKNEAKQQGVGLLYFNTSEEATEGLILVNHQQVDTRNIKLCYSPAKY